MLDRGKKTVHIGAFVSEDFYKRISAAADKERRAIADIIRFSLEEKLDRDGRKK